MRCGLDRGECSSRAWRICDVGENGWFVADWSAAPLLARLRLVLPIEAVLEFVDCDQRLRLFNPSLVPCSDGSTARLFLRLRSCDMGSRPTRNAISDVSPGLCGPIGAVEFLAPVLDELSEPVRLMVTTEEEDREPDREEDRVCLVRGAAALPPLLAAETVAAVPCIIFVDTRADG